MYEYILPIKRITQLESFMFVIEEVKKHERCC